MSDKNEFYINRLNLLHIVSGIWHIIDAAFYGGITIVDLRSSNSVSVNLGYRWDAEYPYEGNVSFKPSGVTWNFMYCFIAIEFITAGFNALYYMETRRRAKFLTKGIAKNGTPGFYNGSHELRWVEYAITATLGTLGQLVGTGNNTLPIFILVATLGVVLQFYGMQSERARTSGDAWIAFSLGSVVQGAVWAVLFSALSYESTALAEQGGPDGSPSPPPPPPPGSDDRDYDWPAYGPFVYLAWYMTFPIIAVLYLAYKEYPGSIPCDDSKKPDIPEATTDRYFLYAELAYAVASLTSKVSISLFVISRVRIMMENDMEPRYRFNETLPPLAWEALSVVSIALPAALLLMLVAFIVRDARRVSSTAASGSSSRTVNPRSKNFFLKL